MKYVVGILVILFGVTLGLAQTTQPTTQPSPPSESVRYDWSAYNQLISPTDQQKLDWLVAHVPVNATYTGDKALYIRQKVGAQYRLHVFTKSDILTTRLDAESTALSMEAADVIDLKVNVSTIVFHDATVALTYASQITDPIKKATALKANYMSLHDYVNGEIQALACNDYATAYKCAAIVGNQQHVFDYGKLALEQQVITDVKTATDILNRIIGDDFTGTTVTNSQILTLLNNVNLKYPPIGTDFTKWQTFIGQVRYKITALTPTTQP